MTGETLRTQPVGTPIWIHLTFCNDPYYCDDFVLLDAFDLKTDTRWSFLHDSYADAYTRNV
jgi:hypothetical protein